MPQHKFNQTAAAYSERCCLNETKGVKNITPVLRSLLWLPACQRLDLLHHEPSGPLTLSGTGLLTFPKASIKHGEAAFRVFCTTYREQTPKTLSNS